MNNNSKISNILNDINSMNKTKKIDSYTNNPPDDIIYLMYQCCKQPNFKIAILLFIFYILYNTDIFYEKVLVNISSNTYNKNNEKITEKGLLTIGILLSLTYIIIDLLDTNFYI